ncbi:MAG TPA: BON domain-containing protein [Thermoanaerobaculia bacterium]|jgi:osmotically-inducible protein OsmY|nr:BON domain-containing protein [Thermoanaerobaculia bacterium]
MMRTITKAVAIAAILTAITPVALAANPEATDITTNFRTAGASIERLQVYEIAGIVILRGRTHDKAQAEELGRYAQSLGYARVANLIQIREHRDVEIARQAEVELAVNRSLDGCRFSVTAEQGVLKLAGSVKHELQKDVAMAVLRNIDGVREVQADLNRF